MRIDNESIDINTLKFLYVHYKDFVIPFFIILVSIVLLGRVVAPSLFDLFDAQEKQKTELQNLSSMKNNLSLLKSIDEATLDSQLRIVSKALPIDKDFEGVLNAISDASDKSGVTIGGFKFLVGNLSEIEEETDLPTLEVDLTVNGSVYDANDFIGRLNKTLPISEISNISGLGDIYSIKINFYYKRLAHSEPNDSIPLSPVSPKGLSLINEISSNFSIPQSSMFDLPSQATRSADINPNPFE